MPEAGRVIAFPTGGRDGAIEPDARVRAWRLQAAALYPLLTGLLSSDPATAADIDAGRPFESSLAAAMDGYPPEHGTVRAGRDGRITVAKLRRLRYVAPPKGILHGDWRHNMRGTMAIVRGLPLDLVPSGPEAWAPVLETGAGVRMYRWADRRGLPLSDLFGGMGLPDHLDYATEHLLPLASDMVERLTDTLTAPVVGTHDREGATAAAARLLCAGRGLKGILDASARWHYAMGPFERDLPPGDDRATWPALFEPWEGMGHRIVSLTKPSELRAEGDPVTGLDHCVAGYARKCWSGRSSVLSIRRRDAGGEWRPVSTAEIRVHGSPHGSQTAVSVMQHRGRSNAPPDDRAVAAFDALVGAIGLRQVSVDPEASKPRDPAGFDDGVDWASDDAVVRTARAWAPFLARRMRDRTPDGIRAAVFGAARG